MEVNYDIRSGGNAEDMPHWEMEGNEILAYHYPFCCTGIVLARLGGMDCESYSEYVSYVESLTEQIYNWIEWFTKSGCHSTDVNAKQFISVCTTNTQEVANKVLTELGFECTKLMNNTKYDNKLMTWILPLNGYAEQEAKQHKEKSICVD